MFLPDVDDDDLQSFLDTMCALRSFEDTSEEMSRMNRVMCAKTDMSDRNC
jgi:hypothetical protein